MSLVLGKTPQLFAENDASSSAFQLFFCLFSPRSSSFTHTVPFTFSSENKISTNGGSTHYPQKGPVWTTLETRVNRPTKIQIPQYLQNALLVCFYHNFSRHHTSSTKRDKKIVVIPCHPNQHKLASSSHSNAPTSS